LAEWQRLRRERGIRSGQMLVVSMDEIDVLTAYALREAIR
jgi:hypothetical protein